MDAVPETFFNHFDPQEPLLQRWALDLISTLRGVPDPAVAEAVAERLAGPEFIAAIFEHPDSGLVNRALYALPAKRLRSVSEAIEALWLGDADDDAYPWSLTRKLCDLDPQMAGRLFEQTLQTCLADPKSRESLKLPQIAVALPDLDHPAAPQMARTLIDLYLRLAETDAQAPMFPDYLLALAWRFEHPEVLSFLEGYLADPRNWEGRPARWRLVQLAYLLADADAEFHLACDRIEKRARLDLEELAPFYRPDIDLTAFDLQMGQVGLRRYEGTLDLVTLMLPMVGDMRQARLMRRLIEAQALADKLHKKKQRPYFYGLILALLLRALRRSEVDPASLSADGLLGILAADPVSLPNQDAVFAWLVDQMDPDLRRRLRRQLVATDGAPPALILIELAGRLKDPDLLEALLGLPEEIFPSEDYRAAMERALVAMGEGCFDVIDRIWEEMARENWALTFQAAENLPGDRARQCIDAHFDDLWHLDRERLLEVCMLMGVDCRRRLEPLVNKRQPLIDEAWLTLSLLYGDRSETVKALLSAYYAAEAEKPSLFGQMMTPHDLLEAMPGSIDVELVCGHCGECFSYRLSRIWLNAEVEGDTYPAEELQCLGCHQLADFEYSTAGIWHVGRFLMELNMAHSSAEFEALLEKGPFKILPRMISFNGEKQVGAAVMACRTAIAQDPEDPLLWFELGNIYVNLDHRAKARQSFENAIALAPDAIEAYLMLAQMAIDRDDFADARRQLERGESHLDKPRMLMSAQVNGGQMVHLYRHLQERLTQPDPDLSDLFTHAQPPVLREEKIGRNDPCPCGSGKKYKRCCLAARK
jgi:hypothetical protein